jgi:hypothetical protein
MELRGIKFKGTDRIQIRARLRHVGALSYAKLDKKKQNSFHWYNNIDKHLLVGIRTQTKIK